MSERRWNSERQRWEYPAVHHIDGDPTNNDPANLQVVWPSDHQHRDPEPEPLFRTGTEWAALTDWGKRELTEAQAAEVRRFRDLPRAEQDAEIGELLERIKHLLPQPPHEGS